MIFSDPFLLIFDRYFTNTKTVYKIFKIFIDKSVILREYSH